MINRFLYRSYRFFYRWELWRERRFTGSGWMMIALTGLMGLFSLETNRTMIYQAFAFLLPVMCLAAIFSLFFRGRFDVRRELPRYATVGEKLTYIVTVTNRTRHRQRGLLAIEDSADPCPGMEEMLTIPEPGEEKRNAWDRRVMWFRFQWLISLRKRADTGEFPLLPMEPGATVKNRAELMPLRRGRLHLSGLTITRPDPFGLFKAAVHVPQQHSVLILPRRYPVPSLTLPGSRRFQPGGVAMASSVGDSQEFLSVREYRPGDPLRHIHWKSWARIGKPVIKEFQDEFFVRHALILDTFEPNGETDAFEAAVSVAASFVDAFQTREALLDLMFVEDRAYCFSAGRGLSDTGRMLEILADVTACRDKSFESLFPAVFENAARLSGCLCVLLKWDDLRREFIRRLRGMRLPLQILVIRDPIPDDGFDSGPMKDMPGAFHILETGKIKEGLAAI